MNGLTPRERERERGREREREICLLKTSQEVRKEGRKEGRLVDKLDCFQVPFFNSLL